MCRRRERGVALVAATIALAVVSALATGLAWTTVVDQRLVRNAVAAAQADALLRSGVAAAAVVLRETGEREAPDTLRAPWAHPSGRQPLGAGWLAVTIEDEARRLDVNGPPAELARLLAVVGLDARLAAAVGDWADADDLPRPDGAERDWYARLPLPRLPRNGELRSVSELGLVRGFDAATLARLRPLLASAGEHGVNPNTAPREVLLALGADGATVERVLESRRARALRTPDFEAVLPGVPSARLVERTDSYRVRVEAAVGDIHRAVEATLWMPPGTGRAPEVVGWEPLPGVG